MFRYKRLSPIQTMRLNRRLEAANRRSQNEYNVNRLLQDYYAGLLTVEQYRGRIREMGANS